MVALANAQRFIVARRQLFAIGFTRMAIETRLARQTLVPVFRGVYALGQHHLRPESWWMAAVLACGDAAALSHRFAGALQGLRGAPYGAIDVTAPGRHRIPGIEAHRRPPVPSVVIGGIPVTTVEQTIVDLAPSTPGQRLRTLLENAMRQQLIDFGELRALAAGRTGRPGMTRLVGVIDELDDIAPRTHAGLEQTTLELIRADGLPMPHLNAVVEGYEVDFSWPGRRVIAETDGWRYHRGRRSFEEDRRRDAALTAAGWRVLRITDTRLKREPRAVLEQLRILLTA